MAEMTGIPYCDEEPARLLPWYLNGRLDAAESARVARHLERCAICRDDLACERALRAQLKSGSSVEYAPQPGLANTLARIDELERETSDAERVAPPLARVARRWPTTTRWLAAAVLLQAVALGFMGTIWSHRVPVAGSEAKYVTLSATPAALPAGPHIRIVFSPEMQMVKLTALLKEHSLSVISGPTDAGVYTLAFDTAPATSERLNQTIATLRSDPRVMFVEPAINDGASSR